MAAPTALKTTPVILRRDYWVRMTLLFCFIGMLSLSLVLMGRLRMWPMTAFGIFTFGMFVGIYAWNYFRGAREFDANGVIRRDGRRFEWADLGKVDRVHARLHSGELGALNHLVMRFKTGVVTVFPFTIEDPFAIIRAVEGIERKRDCDICPKLGEYQKGFQKGGEGTWLPPESDLLKSILEVRPGKNRTPVLKQCPKCGTYYLYETTYEFLVYGSEDEQILSRLTDEEAAKYLQQ